MKIGDDIRRFSMDTIIASYLSILRKGRCLEEEVLSRSASETKLTADQRSRLQSCKTGCFLHAHTRFAEEETISRVVT